MAVVGIGSDVTPEWQNSGGCLVPSAGIGAICLRRGSDSAPNSDELANFGEQAGRRDSAARVVVSGTFLPGTKGNLLRHFTINGAFNGHKTEY
jgi:hypothetical protein